MLPRSFLFLFRWHRRVYKEAAPPSKGNNSRSSNWKFQKIEIL